MADTIETTADLGHANKTIVVYGKITSDLKRSEEEAKKLYDEWNPIDEQRKQLKLDHINQGILLGMASRVPSERELLEGIYGPQESWDDDDRVLMLPDWMDPVFLRFHAKLEELGVAHDNPDFEAIRLGLTTKTKRIDPKNNAWVEDYTDLGWPKSAGSPVRYVTPEEDREIRCRFRSMGLTRPGSEVAVVGKSLAQIVREETTKPEWIIEGLLRRGGAMMVHGPSGVGKSWFTHTLMLMAAHGQGVGIKSAEVDRWILRAGPHEGANVCLIDGEMVLADIAERTRVITRALGIGQERSLEGEVSTAAGGLPCALPSDLPSALENIEVVAKADQDHRAEFVDLADRAWLHQIVENAKERAFDVVVFDNLSTLCPSLEDENAAHAWNPLNDTVVALKREGIAVVLVHHSGKSASGKGGDYRGSSNLVTTLETQVALQKVESATAGDARFTVEIRKSRNHGAAVIDGKTLRLQEGRWVVDVDEYGMAAEVVRMVKSLRYTTQAEIADQLGCDQSTVSKVFRTAEALELGNVFDLKNTLKRAKRLREENATREFDGSDEMDEEVVTLDI